MNLNEIRHLKEPLTKFANVSVLNKIKSLFQKALVEISYLKYQLLNLYNKNHAST